MKVGIILLLSLGAVFTRLNFNDNHDFTILQFTDLHYGEADDKDQLSQQLQKQLIEKIKPDLVVITGDAVSGYAWDNKNTSFYQNCWQKFTGPMLDQKVLYAYTFGNHDDQGNLKRDEILSLDASHPYSLIQRGPKDISGATNYILPIYSNFKNDTIVSHLWLFDSNDVWCSWQPISWGCIERNQINWYREQSDQLKSKFSLTHDLAFFHIPLPEYMEMYNTQPVYGLKNEDVCCPTVNTRIFDSIVEKGNIKHVFVGHDHNNDYGGFFNGIELVYGRKTGHGGYGPPEGMQRGARVIKLHEILNSETGKVTMGVDHFIIQEDLTVVQNGDPYERADQKQHMCGYPGTETDWVLEIGGVVLAFITLIGIIVWIVIKRSQIS